MDGADEFGCDGNLIELTAVTSVRFSVLNVPRISSLWYIKVA